MHAGMRSSPHFLIRFFASLFHHDNQKNVLDRSRQVDANLLVSFKCTPGGFTLSTQGTFHMERVSWDWLGRDNERVEVIENCLVFTFIGCF